MSTFKIGEKVVCVEPIYNLKKDGDYIIEAIYNCVCGNISFDLNVKKIAPEKINIGYCYCKCGNLTNSFNAFSSHRFRKLDYQFAENLLAELTQSAKSEYQLN